MREREPIVDYEPWTYAIPPGEVPVVAPRAEGRQQRTEREEAILQALVAVARPEILRSFRQDSCIASTAIAVEVLRRLGLPSRALTVELAVFNRPFVERLREEGVLPRTEADVARWQEAGCHSVQVGRVPDKPEGLGGHLVAIAGERWLVDLSIDQVNRPAHGIRLAPLYWPVEQPFLRGKEGLSIAFDRGLVVYQARPGDAAYRRSPDWQKKSRHREPVERILALLAGSGGRPSPA